MQIVYKIFNPQTGQYADAFDSAECLSKLAETAWKYYCAHAHNAPYSICEMHEDGSQIWRNPQGEEILSPEQVLRVSELKISEALTAIPPTPIEEMP